MSPLTINDLADCIQGTLLSGTIYKNREITTGYCCDLLSRVMAQAPAGCAWVTVLANVNVIAVAELAEIGCVILPEDIPVPESMISRAEKENIPIISSGMDSYEISWRIHEAITGGKN